MGRMPGGHDWGSVTNSAALVQTAAQRSTCAIANSHFGRNSNHHGRDRLDCCAYNSIVSSTMRRCEKRRRTNDGPCSLARRTHASSAITSMTLLANAAGDRSRTIRAVTSSITASRTPRYSVETIGSPADRASINTFGKPSNFDEYIERGIDEADVRDRPLHHASSVEPERGHRGGDLVAQRAVSGQKKAYVFS